MVNHGMFSLLWNPRKLGFLTPEIYIFQYLATIKQFQLLLYQLKKNNMQSNQANTGFAQPVRLQMHNSHCSLPGFLGSGLKTSEMFEDCQTGLA